MDSEGHLGAIKMIAHPCSICMGEVCIVGNLHGFSWLKAQSIFSIDGGRGQAEQEKEQQMPCLVRLSLIDCRVKAEERG